MGVVGGMGATFAARLRYRVVHEHEHVHEHGCKSWGNLRGRATFPGRARARARARERMQVLGQPSRQGYVTGSSTSTSTSTSTVQSSRGCDDAESSAARSLHVLLAAERTSS